MILTIQLSPDADYGLFQLIEKAAPAYLPVSRIPATQYYQGHSLASTLGMTPEELLEKVMYSKFLHAVVLPTGAFYIHPDGLVKLLAKRNKKRIAKFLKAC